MSNANICENACRYFLGANVVGSEAHRKQYCVLLIRAINVILYAIKVINGPYGYYKYST